MPLSLLTVGMPVYNGERFVAKAIESFLNQTFADFELFISDNASTDGTEEICRKYTASDARVRYLRNARNLGAGWNQRRVYSLGNGKYFKLAAHDDFCEPRFFEVCVGALERDPHAVLAHTKTRILDEAGRLIEDYECALRTDSEDPIVRLRDLTLIGHRCFQIFGIQRRSVLDQLPPIGSYAHADRILLAQLGLMGRFIEIPERLFLSTRHDGQSVWTVPSRCNARRFSLTGKVGTLPSLEWWDPNRSRTVTLPECNAFAQYCLSIWRSKLHMKDKFRGYSVMLRWLAKYHRRVLGDFLLAADQVLWNLQSLRATNSRMHQTGGC